MAFHVPEYIQSLVPYVPGKPISETQREFKIKKVVKLASNENPLGPSPKATRAVQKALKEVHRYPDAGAYELKQTLAKQLDVSASSLILGNGSNEVIDFLIRTYCVPGDSIVTSQAAFIAYKISAQIQGVKTLELPLSEELRFDIQEMVDWVRKDPRVRIVFIANPNNPTGTYLNSTDLRELLVQISKIREGSILVVLDYAYWEYVTVKDLPDPTPWLREFPNLVILRTFSKIYGLAGIRLGYGIASTEIVSSLEKVRQPFNVNSLALVAAQAAVADYAFVEKAKKLNDQGYQYWKKELTRIGIPFWESQGNFLLVDVMKGCGRSAADVYQACLQQGVIFRPVANYGLPHSLRITIGKPQENEWAVHILEKQAAHLKQKMGRRK